MSKDRAMLNLEGCKEYQASVELTCSSVVRRYSANHTRIIGQHDGNLR